MQYTGFPAHLPSFLPSFLPSLLPLPRDREEGGHALWEVGGQGEECRCDLGKHLYKIGPFCVFFRPKIVPSRYDERVQLCENRECYCRI